MPSCAARTYFMATVRVEVVYALPGSQEIFVLDLEEGATVADAIAASRLAGRYPSIRGQMRAVGVHGRVVPASQPVSDGDRIEIYRPLIADPIEARRRRARKT